VTTDAGARQLVDQLVSAYNSRTTNVLFDLYHPNLTYWSVLDGTCEGRQAVIDHIEHLHMLLPDEQMRAKTVTADNEVIVVEFESTGTVAGGRAYLIEFTEVFEVAEGKVTSIKVYLDPDDVASISA
jgi:ketosteroid isomerase-like protein